MKLIDESEEDVIQQIISLRDYATHDVLPDLPEDLLHHLFYFGCMSFKSLVQKQYPTHYRSVERNYLSISLSKMTTYADRVAKLVSKRKKGKKGEDTLVWLLERGIRFEGAPYVPKKQLELSLKGKKKIMSYLELGQFIKDSDMVRIVAVTAPKNHTVDVSLRRGAKQGASLPVVYKKTTMKDDYPHRTQGLAEKLGKGRHIVLKAIDKLKIKGNSHYHQPVPSGKTSVIQCYSDATLHKLKEFFENNPNYNPYGKSSS